MHVIVRRSAWTQLRRIVWFCFAPFLLHSAPALAVPSFARQTGQPCSSCHTVFPELTQFGRQFKLRGYTLGNQLDDQKFPYNLPLAIGLQAGNTHVADRSKGADAKGDFPEANKNIIQQLALYYAGRVYGKVGAMAQFNWDGIEKKWGAEMVDIRYSDDATVGGKDLIYGVDVANSPAVQDIWNTSPMWSFPHLDNAGIMPMQTSLMDMTLANQVAGVGAYGFLDGQFYGEAGFFHNGKDGVFRVLNLNDELGTAIEGYAPHLRLAWEKDLGNSSTQIGMHFLRARIYPDPDARSGPTNRFTDVALDGQYQYDGGDDMVSFHAFYDHEQRHWASTAGASNSSDKLDSFKANVHYWYKRKVGGGIGLFDYRGDQDMGAYGMVGASAMGNANGSPDTRGWMIEADWLPLENTQNIKLGLRYNGYTKFNGAGSNYNGAGRDASDNNSLFAYVWMLY